MSGSLLDYILIDRRALCAVVKPARTDFTLPVRPVGGKYDQQPVLAEIKLCFNLPPRRALLGKAHDTALVLDQIDRAAFLRALHEEEASRGDPAF